MLFKDLSLIEPLLRALESVGYEQPTPIQEQAIPIVLAQRDLLGCAQTGTGKTAAFALPMLQLLFNNKPSNPNKPLRALILTPTRELAIQIAESFTDYGKNLHLKNLVIFGGVNQYGQTEALKRKPEILIATPGRLLDLMNQGFVSIKDIEIFVLDEADRMLDMGFIHDVKKVIAKLPAKRQTLFFSATMPPEIAGLADSILTNPEKVEVTPVSSTAEKVEQSVYFVEKANKRHLLTHLLKNDAEIRSALVFTRTKHGANKVAADLHKNNIKAEAIHGNKSQNARQSALKSFKAGKIRVLVATDIAARGIDIDELSHVINYELPNVPETYVHRIGRTGRAGLSGIAYSFCEAEEVPYLRDIQKLIGQVVPVAIENPYAADLSAPAAPQAAQRKPQREAKPSRQNGKPQQQEMRDRGPRHERRPGKPQLAQDDRRSSAEGQPRDERRPNNQGGAPRDERRPQQRDERRSNNQGAPRDERRPQQRDERRSNNQGAPRDERRPQQRDERRPKPQQSAANRNESSTSGAEPTATRRGRFASILEVATIQKQARPPRPKDHNRERDPENKQQGGNRWDKRKRR
ncbi:MAG: DEAD/DEAH box helicase [Saprospiraceae bacterium]|nr:DEAD/DEAH box helicase [Saprospiraceae bacterium]